MKVFIDLDGVLCDFLGGIRNLTTHGSLRDKVVLQPVPGTLWPIPEEVWKATDFYFWDKLQKTWFAMELVRYLGTFFGEENLYVLTALHPPGRNYKDGTIEGKMSWIHKNFPKLAGRIIVTSHKYLLAGENTLLIEDSEKQSDAFIRAGGQAYLVPTETNRLFDEVKTWTPADLMKSVAEFLPEN